MGDGTVIHLAPTTGARVAIQDETDNFQVRRNSLEEFCGDEEVFIVEHADALLPEEIVQNAESKLGETGYSLLDHNCEHFATWCATGVAESHQIEMSEAVASAVASMATKAFWTVSRRLALRSALKVHPATMLADGVELVTLTASCHAGLPAKNSKRLAKVSGTVAAAGIGTIIGGPVGAATCVAIHTGSGAVADQFCQAVRRFLKR